jgi:hypothetical protein
MPVNVSVNDRAIVTAGLATRFLDGYHPPFLPVQRRYQIAQVFGRSRYANQKAFFIRKITPMTFPSRNRGAPSAAR